MRSPIRPLATPARAFTLIELLVVIAIISLVASLMLPALSSSRRTAKSTVGFGNLRSLSQIMVVYIDQHRESFPNPFRPKWPSVGEFQDMTWTKIAGLTDHTQRWDFAVPDCPTVHTEGFSGVWYSYLAEWRSGRRADREQISPADGDLVTQYVNHESDQEVREGAALMPTSFIYPPTFWCKPQRFDVLCRLDMCAEYLETQTLGGVTYPAAKVMLYERADFGSGRVPLGVGDRRARIHVALVDGSCDTVAMSTVLDAIPNNNANLIATEVCCVPPPSPPQYFYATFHGIKGRDLPR